MLRPQEERSAHFRKLRKFHRAGDALAEALRLKGCERTSQAFWSKGDSSGKR